MGIASFEPRSAEFTFQQTEIFHEKPAELRATIRPVARGTFWFSIALNVTGCNGPEKAQDLDSEIVAIKALDASWVAAGQSKNVDAWVRILR